MRNERTIALIPQRQRFGMLGESVLAVDCLDYR